MRPPPVPASFFGIVLGLGGLGGAWRAASRVWGMPSLVGELLMLLAAVVWACLVLLPHPQVSGSAPPTTP